MPLIAVNVEPLKITPNKVIKSDGGAINILQNETALLKWMVAGP